MPRFEVNQYGSDQELIFKPADGDLRCNNSGFFERWQAGSWQYVGDIDQLFRDFEITKNKVVELDYWMIDEAKKDAAQVIADELEDKDDALREAGCHLRQLEKMLRVARKTYNSMTIETREKMKTFERLDTPYPDDEEGPGYSI